MYTLLVFITKGNSMMKQQSTQFNVDYKRGDIFHNLMYKASVILMVLFTGTLIYSATFVPSVSKKSGSSFSEKIPFQFVSFYKSNNSNFRLK
jgi:galactitol-specific phosphotransferase system IIC component